MTTHRPGYRRLELDHELLARVRAAYPGSCQWSTETVDTYAERMGLQRRILEDQP